MSEEYKETFSREGVIDRDTKEPCLRVPPVRSIPFVYLYGAKGPISLTKFSRMDGVRGGHFMLVVIRTPNTNSLFYYSMKRTT